jgi:hypothetical protein
MKDSAHASIAEARRAAIEVLLHNSCGPYHSLFRTAGWGYPEPYTRDLMISSLGILVSGNQTLIDALHRVLETLGRNQNRLGQVPSLAHDPDNLGSSDTTPLFLIAVALFRSATGRRRFLEREVERALTWMEYQSPADTVMVTQQPTSDWRDEQWVWGYGLFVNTLIYTLLKLHGQEERARTLSELTHQFDVKGGKRHRHVHAALAVRHKPYYALFSYKMYRSERFDLLGNSLAILSGLAAPSRARGILSWVEDECEILRKKGDLAVDLPPCLMPYILREDPDWRSRYEQYNPPGDYHNGGIWPFICGFYVAAAVAAGRARLAREKLLALTRLVRPARQAKVAFGFNEWFRARDGTPQGQDWQTWSAAMYLYAAEAVERGETPFFDEVRGHA